MKQLRVLLVVKDTAQSYESDNKLSGLFSYRVPEFRWKHVVLGSDFDLDTRKYEGQYDLIFHLDGSNWGRYRGDLPVVYWGIDSTLSDEHHRARREQAREADLVLVEHDELARYSSLMVENGRSKGPHMWRPGDKEPAPVRRFPYCVNDRLFSYQEKKTFDIGWHAHTTGLGGDERKRAWKIVRQHAEARGYTINDCTVGNPHAYAKALGSSRVIFSWPRVIGNRPHRILDAMMCGAAVLSGPVPDCGDGLVDWQNIVIAQSPEGARDLLDELLANNYFWRDLGNQAHSFAFAHHRWCVRATELRRLLAEIWPQRFGQDAE